MMTPSIVLWISGLSNILADHLVKDYLHDDYTELAPTKEHKLQQLLLQKMGSVTEVNRIPAIRNFY